MAFSVVWFAAMAVLHATFAGSNPVVFGIGLFLGATLFGAFVNLVRDAWVPGFDRRRIG